MKTKRIILLAFALIGSAVAEPADPQSIAEKHEEGANKVAEDQDELSADVQQLTVEETVPQVIELLEQVEGIMDETTDRLMKPDTGGETIAAQTEVIEKILAAAQERQKQKGSGQAGGAMMDMMQRMAGKEPGGEGQQGQPEGEQPGTGLKGGESDTPNDAVAGASGGQSEARRVPKAAGTAGKALPEEFRKALDAYNRGVEGKGK